MVLRSVVGAGAGVLAGLGYALTVDWHRDYCYASAGRTGCGYSGLFLVPLVLVCWMVVAGLLIWAGFRMGRATGGWRATGLGSGLWFALVVGVVWFKTMFLDMYQDEGHLFLMQAAVVTAGVAYLVAAVAVGRARPC